MRPTLSRARVLALTAGLAAVAAPAMLAPAQAGRIAPGLEKKLTGNRLESVIVRFNLDRATSGKELLKDMRSQLKSALDKVGKVNGLLNRYLGKELRATELWLDQSIALKAPPELIRALAALPEVDVVFENFPVRIPKVVAQSTSSAPAGTPWHLAKIGAPQAWSMGARGQNVKVGHLDTGIDASHPEISGKVAAFAEFNDLGERVSGANPHDSSNHGTHTAGLIAGKSVGSAPEAKLLSALVLPEGAGTFAQVIAGMQWTIDPDNNASTDDGADVVSLSLGLPGTYGEFVQPTKNMLAAGVIPVFAIGNFGPNGGSTGSPGNIPDALGIGATDQNDAVPSFSSRGPVAWSGEYNGVFVKPDLVAPGNAITSSFPGGGYGALSGTSQATPIAAGAIAGMLSAKPGTNFAAVKNALFSTAKRIGGTEKNNTAGYGLINLPAALASLGVASSAQAPATQPAPAPTPTTQPAPAPAPTTQPAPAPTTTTQPAPAPATSAPAPAAKLSVLLVDDDQNLGPDVTTFYRDPIKANAATAFVWNVAQQGAVPLSELKKYQAVVWATGESYENTLTAADQNNLRQYLAGGGKVLVTGQDIGYDIGTSDFYASVLKAKFVADSSGTANLATSGSIGERGLQLNASGSAVNQYYPDVIAPLSGANLVATYGGTGTTAGTITAQSIKDDTVTARESKKANDVRGLVDGAGKGRATAPGQQKKQTQAAAPKVVAQSAGEPAGAGILFNGGSARVAYFGFGLEGITADARGAIIKSVLEFFAR